MHFKTETVGLGLFVHNNYVHDDLLREQYYTICVLAEGRKRSKSFLLTVMPDSTSDVSYYKVAPFTSVVGFRVLSRTFRNICTTYELYRSTFAMMGRKDCTFIRTIMSNTKPRKKYM